MFYSILPFLSTIPGTNIIQKGVDTAANSFHQEMNTVLAAIILVLVLAFICVVKYLIKEKATAVMNARTDWAKEQAINEGAHQRLIDSKDSQIKHLIEENSHSKLKLEEFAEDNIEIYQQLVQKVGSFVEGQAVLSGQIERIKAELLLEIMKIFNKA